MLFNYVYDRYGNRWQQNITQGSGPQPQLSFNASNNQVVGYQYDAVGNVLNDGVHTYTYDAENNLIGIDNGATATFVYDALNERVKVSTSAGAQDYGYDLSGRRSTVWLPGSTSMNAVQYYAGSNRVAYWTASDGNIHFEHQDWLGTERMRTSATASVDGSYSSLPYGDNLQVSGSDTNPGHFAMLDQDISASSGLSHAMFREYSETAGRWMSPDLYSASYRLRIPQTLNRYSYVSNQPLSGNDPTGQEMDLSGFDDVAGWGSDPCDFSACVTATNTCDDFDVCITNPTPPETQAPTLSQTDIGPTGTAPNRNPAPNNPTPPPCQNMKWGCPPQLPTLNLGHKIGKKMLDHFCGSSPTNEVLQSAEDGAVLGGVGGGLAGFFGGGIFTEGLAAVPGAAVGTFVGSVFGATQGIVEGSEHALVCQIFNVY